MSIRCSLVMKKRVLLHNLTVAVLSRYQEMPEQIMMLNQSIESLKKSNDEYYIII